jgi:uncharacterized protein YdeI (YjbR/CyaY-like superfamily)
MAAVATTLSRKINRLPVSLKRRMEQEGVLELYNQRPPYQRNDYLGWIARAKQEATQQKRIEQMIAELKKGNVYMKMKWTGPH